MNTENPIFVARDGITVYVERRDDASNWNRVVFAPSGQGASTYSAGVDWAPGRFKHAWVTRLAQSGSRCQLPRGFVKTKKPVFVGG